MHRSSRFPSPHLPLMAIVGVIAVGLGCDTSSGLRPPVVFEGGDAEDASLIELAAGSARFWNAEVNTVSLGSGEGSLAVELQIDVCLGAMVEYLPALDGVVGVVVQSDTPVSWSGSEVNFQPVDDLVEEEPDTQSASGVAVLGRKGDFAKFRIQSADACIVGESPGVLTLVANQQGSAIEQVSDDPSVAPAVGVLAAWIVKKVGGSIVTNAVCAELQAQLELEGNICYEKPAWFPGSFCIWQGFACAQPAY
jgi:hypothetical protein